MISFTCYSFSPWLVMNAFSCNCLSMVSVLSALTSNLFLNDLQRGAATCSLFCRPSEMSVISSDTFSQCLVTLNYEKQQRQVTLCNHIHSIQSVVRVIRALICSRMWRMEGELEKVSCCREDVFWIEDNCPSCWYIYKIRTKFGNFLTVLRVRTIHRNLYVMCFL